MKNVPGKAQEIMNNALKKLIFDRFFSACSGWMDRIPGCGRSGMKWFRKTVDSVIKLLFLFCITWIVMVGMLYLCRMFWYLYIETPVGTTFVSHYAAMADPIFVLLELPFFSLSFSLCIQALKACFVIGAVCQLFSIIRFLFLYRGLFFRLFFWGLLCSAYTTYGLWQGQKLPWQLACGLGLFPTLLLMERCFKIIAHVLPELQFILRFLKPERIKSYIEAIKSKNVTKQSTTVFPQEHISDVNAPS